VVSVSAEAMEEASEEEATLETTSGQAEFPLTNLFAVPPLSSIIGTAATTITASRVQSAVGIRSPGLWSLWFSLALCYCFAALDVVAFTPLQ